MLTLRTAAYAVHEANRQRWRNARHAAGWIQTLERQPMPVLGKMPVDTIDRMDVLWVLTPIWTTRPEATRKLRQRMRPVYLSVSRHSICSIWHPFSAKTRVSHFG